MTNIAAVYNLDDIIVEELHARSEEIDLEMGEILIQPESIISHLYILKKGRLRQLVHQPDSQNKLFTLASYEPPFIAGWASLQASLDLELI